MARYLEEQGLQALLEELKLKVVTKSENEIITYSIKPDASSSEYAAVYRLYEKINNGEPTPVEGSVINIPKDFLVKSATLETCVEDDVPVEGYKVGDKYIDFVINTKDGTAENEHIYINLKDLINPYIAGNGINIQDNEISVKTTGIINVDNNGINVNVTQGNGLNTIDDTLKIETVTQLSNGVMLKEDKVKLDSLGSGKGIDYDPNTYQFSVKVDTSNGLDVTNQQGVLLNLVTTDTNGAMSYEDKIKLNNLEDSEGIPQQDIDNLFD